MVDSAKGSETAEHWPFHPQYLTQRVPRELITLTDLYAAEALPTIYGLEGPSTAGDQTPSQSNSPISTGPKLILHNLF